jgi:hypothetical protein
VRDNGRVRKTIVFVSEPAEGPKVAVELVDRGVELIEREPGLFARTSRPSSAGREDDALTTDVLIPAAGGEPWEWRRLVPELTSRRHDAIAVRLPAEDDSAGC